MEDVIGGSKYFIRHFPIKSPGQNCRIDQSRTGRDQRERISLSAAADPLKLAIDSRQRPRIRTAYPSVMGLAFEPVPDLEGVVGIGPERQERICAWGLIPGRYGVAPKELFQVRAFPQDLRLIRFHAERLCCFEHPIDARCGAGGDDFLCPLVKAEIAPGGGFITFLSGPAFEQDDIILFRITQAADSISELLRAFARELWITLSRNYEFSVIEVEENLPDISTDDGDQRDDESVPLVGCRIEPLDQSAFHHSLTPSLLLLPVPRFLSGFRCQEASYSKAAVRARFGRVQKAAFKQKKLFPFSSFKVLLRQIQADWEPQNSVRNLTQKGGKVKDYRSIVKYPKLPFWRGFECIFYAEELLRP